MKQVMLNGYKFTKDASTGYYLSSCKIGGERKRLHRYVWELEKGRIPKGYHIHHIDGDKNNNRIDNLQLLKGEEHASLHGVAKTQEEYQAQVKRMNHARGYAGIWHSSDEGIEWHKKHYERTKEKLHQKDDFVCLQCGKSYRAEATGVNRFCSSACKSAFRRQSGVDDIQKECAFCGKLFKANRYQQQETCGRACANRLRARKKRDLCRP
ncbi:HNH endonuclease signature motif containing protein [Peptococcus simiae]|uniref:HNH endonuclease signature motif containing protein n=1 Tax=Peptococcus simiae TaxID=1643805 RepID=A0ABW9H0L1_9FIRM